MGLVYVIRHKHFSEGLSIRRIAREVGVSRNTVRKYLFQVSEPKRKGGVCSVSPGDGEGKRAA
jgi:transposase